MDRQQVCRDIGQGTLRADLDRFAERMDRVRRALDRAGTLTHRYQMARWQLDAAAEYHRAVVDLQSDLSAAELASRGLTAIRQLLARLPGGAGFQDLGSDLARVRPAVPAIRYRMHIADNQVRVQRDGADPDYADAVEATFHRFRQGQVRDHSAGAPVEPAMNHVESGILDLVAELYPDVFAELDRFGRRQAHVIDDEVAAFDRDIQFFLGYLDYIAPMIAAELPFCYPTFDRSTGDGIQNVEVVDTFDLALAARLVRTGASPPVRNDIMLTGRERILLVTGPNHGGKTTYARTVGQLHQLARLGLPVPGRSARLVLSDNVFTHFARPETAAAGQGKLQADLPLAVITHFGRGEDRSMGGGKFDEELHRMSVLADHLRPGCCGLFNEPFAATNAREGAEIGGQLVRALLDRGIRVLLVTHLYDLQRARSDAAFLRAERRPDGRRTLRIRPGAPESISNGDDLYAEVIAVPTKDARHHEISRARGTASGRPERPGARAGRGAAVDAARPPGGRGRRRVARTGPPPPRRAARGPARDRPAAPATLARPAGPDRRRRCRRGGAVGRVRAPAGAG